MDFTDSIWPILQKRCLECHGITKQSGGLRLDNLAAVKNGGASGQPLLAADGELVRRITLTEPGRMPPEGPPLSETEVQNIKDWITQGARWSEQTTNGVGIPGSDTPLAKLTDWFEVATRHTRWFFIAFLVFAMGTLLVERKKKNGDGSGLLNRIRGSHYLAITLGLALGAMWHHHRMCDSESQTKIDTLESQLVDLANPEVMSGGDEFGPVPRRPQHPPRLGGEYYRGNDERDPRLFNGGFYRTAAFRVFLTNEAGTRLQIGDKLPTGPLFIDFELDRSAGTTIGHYTDHSTSTIYLSRQAGNAIAIDEPVQVEVVEPDWKWRARYRISDSTDHDVIGRVFVYCSASVTEKKISGSRHYGIQYNIRVESGRIAEGSEIWMGSLFQTLNVVQTPVGKIPVDEWFDFRPIPEIVGKNTDDPELLGLGKSDGH